MPFGSLQNATTHSETVIFATLRPLSIKTEEAITDPGSIVIHTKDTKSSLSSSNRLPNMESFSLAEAKTLKTTTTLLSNITVQNSTSPPSLVPVLPVKDGKMKKTEAKINFQDSNVPIVPEINDETKYHESTTAALSTSHIFSLTNPTRSTSQNPGGQNQVQNGSVQFETHSRSLNSWRSSKIKTNLHKEEMDSQSSPQTHTPNLKLLLHSQTSSHKSFLQHQTSSSKHIQLQKVTSQTFPLYWVSSSVPVSKSQPTSPNFILSKSPTLQSPPTEVQPLFSQPLLNKLFNILSHHQPPSNLIKRQLENSSSDPTIRQKKISPHKPLLQTIAPLSTKLFSLPQTFPSQTGGQASIPHTNQYQSDTPPKALSISPQPWLHRQSQSSTPRLPTFDWKQNPTSITPKSMSELPFTSRFETTFNMGEGTEVTPLQSHAKIETMRPIFEFRPSLTPPFTVSTDQTKPHSLSLSSHTHAASLPHPSFGTFLYRTKSSNTVSIQTPFTHETFSHPPSSSSTQNQLKTAPTLSALPSPSPLSIPPHFPSIQHSSLSPIPSSLTPSTIPSLNSSHNPPADPFLSSVPLSTSSSSPFTSSQSITSSPSSSTISPSIFSTTSAVSSSSSPHSLPHPPSTISTSTSTSSAFSLDSSSSSVSSHSISPYPEPPPTSRRSLYHPFTSTSISVPPQEFIQGQKLQIQNHFAPSDPESNFNLPTPTIMVHPNPEPHPNLDPNFKQNFDHKLKVNTPNTDSKPKHPYNPSTTPDKEGKFPDIIPRHSAWELGMLLGCSVGLGMVLVVGLRYMYSQACGKRTEVTLNDREREYGRGERGLIHVQECGDLVRVQRIRDNSFVLLAEYDILASPGD